MPEIVNNPQSNIPSQQPIEQIEQPNTTLNEISQSSPVSEEPKRSKTWKIILIILLIAAIGYGGYYVYINYLASPKKRAHNEFIKYQKGPNLPIEQKDIYGYFYYSHTLDSIFYQKKDLTIYSNFLNKKDYPVLDTYGGNVISISPSSTNYGNYAVIYYSEGPKIADGDSPQTRQIKDALKNAKENYFLVDLDKNTVFSIGQNLSNFMWSGNNVYLIRNNYELLSYDLRMANYTAPIDQPDNPSPYYKILDFPQPIIDIDLEPNSINIYAIVKKDDKNILEKINTKDKQISALSDTTATSIDFSLSGKYYALFANDNLKIYETKNNALTAEIANEVIEPRILAWDNEENNFYYFKQTDIFSNLETFNEQNIDGYFANLIKYTIANKSEQTIITGKSINLIVPSVFYLNNQNNKIFLQTDQMNNIYSKEL